MLSPKSDMPTLAARLRDAGAANSNYFSLYSLFTEDYFTGLGELTGCMDYFETIYQSYFKFYDPESNVPLAEMTDKAAGFIPETREELLFLLLVQPYYNIAHMERRES